MLAVVLHRVDGMERERREQAHPRHAAANRRNGGGGLVRQQVPAEAGLGALRVLQLHDRRPLDRLLGHPEHARGDLGDDPVPVRHECLRVAALTGAGERPPAPRGLRAGQHDLLADRAERHPAAVPRDRDLDRAPLAAAVQRDRQVRVAVQPPVAGRVREVKDVEPSAGAASGRLHVVGHRPGLRRGPRGQDEVGGPAGVAHGRRPSKGQRRPAVVPAVEGRKVLADGVSGRPHGCRTPRCCRTPRVPGRAGAGAGRAPHAAAAPRVPPSRRAPRAAGPATRRSG
jgi:hypothetical protein